MGERAGGLSCSPALTMAGPGLPSRNAGSPVARWTSRWGPPAGISPGLYFPCLCLHRHNTVQLQWTLALQSWGFTSDPFLAKENRVLDLGSKALFTAVPAAPTGVTSLLGPRRCVSGCGFSQESPCSAAEVTSVVILLLLLG